MPKKAFKQGDKIEVQIAADGWKPATFLRWLSTTKMLVQHRTVDETLPSPPPEDTVSFDAVRPAPPPEPHRYFTVGEEVEAYCSKTKRWRKSVIAEILENSAYTVVFGGERTPVKVEQWWLRVVRRFIGGAWDPPCHLQQVLQKSSKMEVNSRGLKSKIKFNGNSSNENFDEGTLVEIKGHEVGFHGSWYTAIVVEKLENDKLLVEYETLITEDKKEFVKEEVTISSVRPPPPSFEHIPPFDYFDPVDAWYDDGWWVGYVAKILSDGLYVIHFTHSVQEMIVRHSTLRPHQEWNDGKWSLSPKVNLIGESSRPSRVNQKRKYGRRSPVPKFDDGMMVDPIDKRSKTAKARLEKFEEQNRGNRVRIQEQNIGTRVRPEFVNGMKVEVRSDQEGCVGSWYEATIYSETTRK